MYTIKYIQPTFPPPALPIHHLRRSWFCFRLFGKNPLSQVSVSYRSMGTRPSTGAWLTHTSYQLSMAPQLGSGHKPFPLIFFFKAGSIKDCTQPGLTQIIVMNAFKRMDLMKETSFNIKEDILHGADSMATLLKEKGKNVA